MSCWTILGIEPTKNLKLIEQAYEQQRKFIADTDVQQLHEAYHEALAHAGYGDRIATAPVQAEVTERQDTRDAAVDENPAAVNRELTANEQQIVRETVIQIRALLNDNSRVGDPQVWHAIVSEPPVDDPALRASLGEALASDVRPMAENGSLQPDVVAFLGNWFDWQSVRPAPEPEPQPFAQDQRDLTPEELRDREALQTSVQKSFWPAIIGWSVVLIVLTSFFSRMG
ncbi:MAG: J domain-containing protein [Marinobacter sp.]|nr:J domain-containing protein [Marinobacter sp.]